MTPAEQKRLSKMLSYVLRHHPELIGIYLDENGWTEVSFLIIKLNENGFQTDTHQLEEVVSNNAKQRFAFNEGHSKIRANQGHSVEVSLNFTALTPPTILYHGTAEKYKQSILDQGILKQQRHHVHLSADINTAKEVGRRHGKPIVFIVQAEKMFLAKHEFFLSENDVWLTEFVPLEYLSL